MAIALWLFMGLSTSVFGFQFSAKLYDLFPWLWSYGVLQIWSYWVKHIKDYGVVEL